MSRWGTVSSGRSPRPSALFISPSARRGMDSMDVWRIYVFGIARMDVQIRFVNPSGAWLCGGRFREPGSRTQWQAVVVPTRADNPDRGIVGRKYTTAMAFAFVPHPQTRQGAIERLKAIAQSYGYCELEVHWLSPSAIADEL